MSRLEQRKNKKTVVEELSTSAEDLSKFERVTFTIRKKDVNELEGFVKSINEGGRSEERITKSLVVRKALKLVYDREDLFT